MKRSRPTPLIGLGVAGIVVGFLIELAAAGTGIAIFIPPLTLPITLVLIAVIVVVFAVPIRRATHGSAGRPIDPFQAMRVVVLAKACSLVGALLTGAGLGVLFYLVSRAVIPVGNAVWISVAATVGAAVLLVAGLIAEHMCILPPDDKDDDHPENTHVTSP